MPLGDLLDINDFVRKLALKERDSESLDIGMWVMGHSLIR